MYGEDRKPIVSFEQNRPSIYGYIDNIFLNGISRLRFGHSIKFNYGNKPLQVSYITGADLIIPRKILEKVGGFDPTFFMYYEEIELCCRIVKAGYREQDTGNRIQGTGNRIQGTGDRIQGTGYRGAV